MCGRYVRRPRARADRRLCCKLPQASNASHSHVPGCIPRVVDSPADGVNSHISFIMSTRQVMVSTRKFPSYGQLVSWRAAPSHRWRLTHPTSAQRAPSRAGPGPFRLFAWGNPFRSTRLLASFSTGDSFRCEALRATGHSFCVTRLLASSPELGIPSVGAPSVRSGDASLQHGWLPYLNVRVDGPS